MAPPGPRPRYILPGQDAGARHLDVPRRAFSRVVVAGSAHRMSLVSPEIVIAAIHEVAAPRSASR